MSVYKFSSKSQHRDIDIRCVNLEDELHGDHFLNLLNWHFNFSKILKNILIVDINYTSTYVQKTYDIFYILGWVKMINF
jgi:hypothetical protein